ncbi:MAG TPA: VacJ family lipoprotein [Stellaceae bacterium]|jgi:phospholipid-binding lipoprotein MlaA|nr:VacJ family lipoprotein [Stellaceae bacterium]
MRVHELPFLLPGALAAGLALSGCAAPGPSGGGQAASAGDGFNDPYEETNRSIFAFNQAVDRNVLVPVAKTYRTVVPAPMQQSMHDFLQNLDAPIVFANDVLQGQGKLAGQTFVRFTVNSTVGIGGMLDVATHAGIPYHSNDLGITFATWGVGEGPYIMLPVLGPSNPRDLVGQVGDSFGDPGNIVAGDYNLIWASIARGLAQGIDERARNIDNLADIEHTSIDFYATIRSLYKQRREAEIRHEQPNLPNPSPVQGRNAQPGPYISYSFVTPQFREDPSK